MTGAFALAAALIGVAAGWAFFASLAWVTDLLVAGRIAGVVVQVGRFFLLGAFLWLCTHGGWVVLIAGAGGVLAGRALVLRRYE